MRPIIDHDTRTECLRLLAQAAGQIADPIGGDDAGALLLLLIVTVKIAGDPCGERVLDRVQAEMKHIREAR